MKEISSTIDERKKELNERLKVYIAILNNHCDEVTETLYSSLKYHIDCELRFIEEIEEILQ